MKRWFVGILCLVLLLAGCDAAPSENTTEQTQPSQTETLLPKGNINAVGSAIVAKSGDTLRAYSASGDAIWLGFMDRDAVLLCAEGESVTAVRFDPETGDYFSEKVCTGLRPEDVSSIGLNANRFAYYDAQACVYRILDRALQEVDTVAMPQGVTGTPLLSADLTTAYFCVGDEIWSMDMQSGVSRLVLRLDECRIRIDKLLINDTVLGCYIVEADGDSYTEFFSAATGESLGRDEHLTAIDSWGESYLVRRMDGSVPEILVGSSGKTLQSLALEEQPHMLTVLPGMASAAKVVSKDGGLFVDLIDLTDGSKKGTLVLMGLSDLNCLKDGPEGKYLWFIAKDSSMQADILCRWDISSAANEDGAVDIGTRYTAQNPDIEGLSLCQTVAEALEKKYSVDLQIYTDAVAPDGYAFVSEYQVEALRTSLETLDAAMAKFPDGFFKTAAKVTKDRTLHIQLVRSISAKRVNPRDISGGLQYWSDGNAFIVLVPGENLEKNFYNNLSHAMDTYIYSYSIHYDFWNDRNPKGFAYDENYGVYGKHSESQWLQPETRAFVNAYSMTFAHEDRAAIFACAMMDGNEDLFTTDTMQAKLKQLCMGIREAFGLEKSKDTFPWEQYLKESLAYTKKK